MATTEFIAAIEIASSRISGIAGRRNSDGSIQVLAHACKESASFVRKGIIYNIDKAAQALRDMVDKLNAQLEGCVAKVYVGIGGQSMHTVKNTVERPVEGGKVTSELVDSLCDENRECPLEGKDILDVAPQEYVIDNMRYVEPVGVSGQHIVGNFLNIVACSDLQRRLNQSFGQARVEIADLMVAPMALARGVLSENDLRAGCALVDFGAGTTTVAVYKDSLLRYLCVIPLGGESITRDIMSLRLEQHVAEALKLQYGRAVAPEEEEEDSECRCEDGTVIRRQELDNLVEARVEEILLNVKQQIGVSGYSASLYSGVVLTGGGSSLKEMETAFKRFTGMEKVRTAQSVQTAVHGFQETLHDPRQFTLLSLLMAGHENCCQLPDTAPGTLFNEDEMTPEAPIGNVVADNDTRKPDRQTGNKSGGSNSSKEEKKEKKNPFKDIFNKMGSLFDDEPM
ncbi:MAG: cell division protein FtsA [Bacteroides sp.]|nr:cell division protein FtsA [Bacteroides sp.]